MEALLIVVGMAGMVAIAVLVGCLIDGWMLSTLWGWFIVPTFGLLPLSVPSAIGISLVVRWIVAQRIPTSKEEEWWIPLVWTFIRVSIVLGAGWIVKGFL